MVNGMKSSGKIYVGVGGWNFPPWRGVFYPKGLAQAKELNYAATHLTSIEINSTFYGSQKPESFRKWAREVPDGFVFSVKGPRFATNRRVLAEASDTIKTGYPPKELDAWAERLQMLAQGDVPKDLPRLDPNNAPKSAPRDVFAYVIHEGKVRAPAAAMALIERLKVS